MKRYVGRQVIEERKHYDAPEPSKAPLKIGIAVVIVIALILLFITKPWQPSRYDGTPAGIDAEKIDLHVQDAFEWKDWREAREFVGTTESEKYPYYSTFHMSWADAKKQVDDAYAKGAKRVLFINIHRSVRSGDAPEGWVIELPDDAPTRATIFAHAATIYTARGQTVPPDVKQKFLYFGYGRWSPDKPEPGFMP